jgi:peptide/nickel transport system permease protein
VSQVQQTEPAIEVLVPLEGEPGRIEGRTPWQLFWTRFRRDKVAMGAGLAVLALIAFALLAPVIAAHIVHRGPNDLSQDLTSDIGVPLLGPSKIAWFGVDTLGRDVFIRTLYGARTSLKVSFVGTGFSLVIGIALGLIAGFVGGKVDTLISRTIDIVLSLPLLLLAIGISVACTSASVSGCEASWIPAALLVILAGAVLALGVGASRRTPYFVVAAIALVGAAMFPVLGIDFRLKQGTGLVVFIIALFGWPYVARIVRGQTLSLREREFVEAARATGYGDLHIMFREILPNMVASIIVVATLLIPQNILIEAALSFLGVGIPPDIPSWGGMISQATGGSLYRLAWWMLVFPGLFLVATTLSFNLLGDGLRDALDPRSNR